MLALSETDTSVHQRYSACPVRDKCTRCTTNQICCFIHSYYWGHLMLYTLGIKKYHRTFRLFPHFSKLLLLKALIFFLPGTLAIYENLSKYDTLISNMPLILMVQVISATLSLNKTPRGHLFCLIDDTSKQGFCIDRGHL